MNFTLLSYIKPNKKLSKFCENFLNQTRIDSNWILTKEEEFTFTATQNLALCILEINFKLYRGFKSINDFGNVVLQIDCFLKYKNKKSRVFYEVEPDKLDSRIFYKKLENNLFFREFQSYHKLLNSWQVVIEQKKALTHDKFKHFMNYELLTPFETKVVEKKLTIVPCITRYTQVDHNYKPQFDRYNFCLVVLFDFVHFLPIPLDNDLLLPVEFSYFYSDLSHSEVKRNVGQDKEFDYNNMFDSDPNGNNTTVKIPVQRTEEQGEDFYKDLFHNNFMCVRMTCKFKRFDENDKMVKKKYEHRLGEVEIKNIKDLWTIYMDLKSCNEAQP